jgi:putative FmdB family regulatory protein
MPIYEYECRSCGHEFEFLLLPSIKATPVCPKCQGQDLERLLSGFSVNSAEMSEARANSQRKRLAQSRIYKDKQVAEREHIEEHVKEYVNEHLPRSED